MNPNVIKEVKRELKAIKTNATKKEINKLNLSKFSPLFSDTCIYGQMTGFCCSDRAKELYPKTLTSITNTSDKNNAYYSYLEYFLFKRKCDRDVHKKIIDYLKDDRKGLNFIK